MTSPVLLIIRVKRKGDFWEYICCTLPFSWNSSWSDMISYMCFFEGVSFSSPSSDITCFLEFFWDIQRRPAMGWKHVTTQLRSTQPLAVSNGCDAQEVNSKVSNRSFFPLSVLVVRNFFNSNYRSKKFRKDPLPKSRNSLPILRVNRDRLTTNPH